MIIFKRFSTFENAHQEKGPNRNQQFRTKTLNRRKGITARDIEGSHLSSVLQTPSRSFRHYSILITKGEG
jgi:hypothetical protein